MNPTSLAQIATLLRVNVAAARLACERAGFQVADDRVSGSPIAWDRLDDVTGVPFLWLRTRPLAVQALMVRFPPVCRVLARVRLRIPAPGRIGRVVSYLEDGSLTVQHEDEWWSAAPSSAVRRALCSPEQLRVLQYDGNKTSEWVRRVLDGENIPAINPGLDGQAEGEFPNERS